MVPAMASAAAMSEWQAMLDRIDESVAQALVETEQRERAFVIEDRDDSSRPDYDGAKQPDERMQGLETELSAARQFAAAIESDLAADHSAVQAWQQAAIIARERLDAACRL